MNLVLSHRKESDMEMNTFINAMYYMYYNYGGYNSYTNKIKRIHNKRKLKAMKRE